MTYYEGKKCCNLDIIWDICSFPCNLHTQSKTIEICVLLKMDQKFGSMKRYYNNVSISSEMYRAYHMIETRL